MMCGSKKHGNDSNADTSSYRQRRRRRGRRFFKFLALVGLLWVTASVSYNHGHKIVGYFKLKKLTREMDLTWQQQDRLMDTFFEAFQKTHAQRKEVRKIKQAFYRLMDKDGLTQKELNTFISSSMTKLQTMALAHSGSLLKARNVLTPYQRKVFLVRLQQMDQKRNRWNRRYRRYRRHYRHSEADWNTQDRPSYAQPSKERPGYEQPNEAKPAQVKPGTNSPQPSQVPSSRPTKLSQHLQ